ncbi:hypothetical protein M9Y10_010437 [Tritrichomonas musculus]|uniref:Peptidase M14 domain-containing protein n=1 Tax=Tritrichomonas musculus TaxID=1915356 RepID=A0ABR2IKR8_9EUKA
MLIDEEKEESMLKIHPKIKKSVDGTNKNHRAHLKIEISQIHTIEDDDFILKDENKAENENIQADSVPTTNSTPKKTNETEISQVINEKPSNVTPEIMNNNEKNTIIYHSLKEINYISHPGFSDINATTFAPQSKKPYWPENLWKGGTLIYSYKDPEKCLGPPVFKNDKTIRFNSRFESGNLMYAYRLNPDTYHCILEYDHTLSGQCQWFYFQMSNIKVIPNSNRKITFYISGFNKSNGVFSSGSKIFMYSEKMAKNKKTSWFRAGTNYAYGTTLKKGTSSNCKKDKDKKKSGKNKSKNKRSTLQFQITFPYDDDVVYFCYALPYTFTDLNRSIMRWIGNSPLLIQRRTLCKTYGGKDCPLLTITANNSPSEVKKRCIFITARIHPGESNGSIVLHGLIDFLLSPQPITAYLLDHFIFQIVPMINIDGVVEGYYRVGLEGDDLNRVWNNPDEIRHPVVYHTKKLMFELNRELGIAAYIDFHGHSRQHGTFAYGCPWDSSENLPSSFINKEKVFPRMLSLLCDAFSFERCVFSIPPERKDASRCVIRRELGVVHSFTIESSFGGIPSGPRCNTLYNETIWKEIGARVAEALFHLFSSETSPLVKIAECSSTPAIGSTEKRTENKNKISDFEFSFQKGFPSIKEAALKNYKPPILRFNSKVTMSSENDITLNSNRTKSVNEIDSLDSNSSPRNKNEVVIEKLNVNSPNKIKNKSEVVIDKLDLSLPNKIKNKNETEIDKFNSNSITNSPIRKKIESEKTNRNKNKSEFENLNSNSNHSNKFKSSSENLNSNSNSSNRKKIEFDNSNPNKNKSEFDTLNSNSNHSNKFKSSSENLNSNSNSSNRKKIEFDNSNSKPKLTNSSNNDSSSSNSQSKIFNCLVELASNEITKLVSTQSLRKNSNSVKANQNDSNIKMTSFNPNNNNNKIRAKSTTRASNNDSSKFVSKINTNINNHNKQSPNKMAPVRNKVKRNNNNFSKSNYFSSTNTNIHNKSKAIKSPRMSKSIKVLKSSRANRSFSSK